MTSTPQGDNRSGVNAGPSLGVRMRPDLIIVRAHHKHTASAVVKDPVAMTYHRMRPDELFVLERLKHDETLESLRDHYDRRFSPSRVTVAELNDLLFRFHRLGLTLSDASDQGERLYEKRQQTRKHRWTSQLSSVLFIRFPGINPEPLLRRLYPVLRPLFSATGSTVMVLIATIACCTLAANWSRFASELPAMRDWIQLRAVLILAGVIGGTKVLHELGHAFVCKHFGGECHEIGPMLLVFTPALYCDTSDSWTLTNRYHRAAVGLAGIGTEVLLASLATIVWASTGPTLVHYISMNVMLVCSVSTVLFNANPLLRYDGYYVLADLCDVPNLGERSRGVLARTAARLMFGVDLDDDELRSGTERFWLIAYAIAAVVYRWTLTFLILWFILLMLRPYRLESVGRVLCLITVTGLLYATLRAPILFLRHPGRRRLIRMNRVFYTGIAAVLLVGAAGIPMPSGETAPGRIVPREEFPVFVSTSGHLDEPTTPTGTVIRKGDSIAVLVNHEVVYQYSKARSRVETQRALVDALKSSRSSMNEAASELPIAEAMLEEFERQLESRRLRRDALTIRSPADGRLIAPPKQSVEDDLAELTLIGWTGDPTAPRNRGCLITPGTELFTVVADDRWDAELIVSADQVQRINIGNEVKMVLESAPSEPIHGVVTEISSKQWNADDNRERRDDEVDVKRTTPLETSYAVRVQLESPAPDAHFGLITGAEVSARVSATPISVFGRLARITSRALRFR